MMNMMEMLMKPHSQKIKLKLATDRFNHIFSYIYIINVILYVFFTIIYYFIKINLKDDIILI